MEPAPLGGPWRRGSSVASLRGGSTGKSTLMGSTSCDRRSTSSSAAPSPTSELDRVQIQIPEILIPGNPEIQFLRCPDLQMFKNQGFRRSENQDFRRSGDNDVELSGASQESSKVELITIFWIPRKVTTLRLGRNITIRVLTHVDEYNSSVRQALCPPCFDSLGPVSVSASHQSFLPHAFNTI